MTPTLTLTTGSLIWEQAPDGPDVNFEPRGGVVWQVAEHPDPETGEVVTTYSTVKVHGRYGRLSWATLRADQVDAWSAAAPSEYMARPTLKALVKRMSDILAKGRVNEEFVHLLEVSVKLVRAFR